MWKKTLGIAMILISMSVSAFAAIPRDQMHIGGLKLGMTLQQVAAMYGTPVADTSGTKASGGYYYIANGLIGGWIDGRTNAFIRYALHNEKPEAKRITGTGGLALGMTLMEVENCLGVPDSVEPYGMKNLIMYNSVETRSDGGHDALLVFFHNGRVRSFTINVF